MDSSHPSKYSMPPLHTELGSRWSGLGRHSRASEAERLDETGWREEHIRGESSRPDFDKLVFRKLDGYFISLRHELCDALEVEWEHRMEGRSYQCMERCRRIPRIVGIYAKANARMQMLLDVLQRQSMEGIERIG